jgi:hypothetical protein
MMWKKPQGLPFAAEQIKLVVKSGFTPESLAGFVGLNHDGGPRTQEEIHTGMFDAMVKAPWFNDLSLYNPAKVHEYDNWDLISTDSGQEDGHEDHHAHHDQAPVGGEYRNWAEESEPHRRILALYLGLASGAPVTCNDFDPARCLVFHDVVLRALCPLQCGCFTLPNTTSPLQPWLNGCPSLRTIHRKAYADLVQDWNCTDNETVHELCEQAQPADCAMTTMASFCPVKCNCATKDALFTADPRCPKSCDIVKTAHQGGDHNDDHNDDQHGDEGHHEDEDHR